MTTINSALAQEIFLLNRFSSVEYFGELRDVWGQMLQHLEQCLDEYLKNLPSDLRARPLPEQADIVWSERILPNFRSTYRGLCTGYIGLTHGDFSKLGYANGPTNDFKGQSDYSSTWMKDEDEIRFRTQLNTAVAMAGNIVSTDGAFWRPLDLTTNYSPLDHGPIDATMVLPKYQVSKTVFIKSGDLVRISGVYVPDVEFGCAEFLNAQYPDAPLATVVVRMVDLINPATQQKYGEAPEFAAKTCTWHLIESHPTDRIAEEIANPDPGGHRVMAGDPCPATGYYFTPARLNSRAYFVKGTSMPSIDSPYGATIWQWDSQQ